ncbi:MAG: hypothetical protein ACOCYQ_09090, partial [Alkalispirochaeta sp.]
AYCPRCGVQIEDRLERCPLCDTPIPREARINIDAPGDYPEDVIPPKQMYRSLTPKQKQRLFLGTVVFFAIFPIVLTTILDLVRNGGVTWSYYVSVPMIGAVLLGTLIFRWGITRFPTATAGNLLLCGTLALVFGRPGADGIVPPAGEGSSTVIALLVLLWGAAEAGIVITTLLKRNWTTRVSLIGVVTAVAILGIEIILDHMVIRNSGAVITVGWSAVVAAVIVPLSGFLYYLGRAQYRGLNVLGFVSLDTAVMLVLIDLAVSGGIGWSWITAAVLVPLAVVVYALHVALFNDTDWRKALHL